MMSTAARLALVLLLALATTAEAEPTSPVDSLRTQLTHLEGRERVDVLNRLTEVYAEDEDRLGVGTGREALETATRLGYARGQADAFYQLGYVYFRLGTFTEAIDHYRQALDLYHVLGADEQVGFCLVRLGKAMDRSGRYEEAEAALTKAIAQLEETSSARGVAEARNDLGLLYWSRGYYASALPQYQQALQTWESLDPLRTARTLNNIGTIYFQLGRYENALKVYKRSLKVRRELGDDRGVALVLNNIGLAYQEWGFLDHAYEVYQDAHALVDTMRTDMVLGYTLNNLGTVLQARGLYAEALDHYQRSMRVYETIDNQGGRVLNLISIGKLYHEQGRSDEALQFLHAAYEQARAAGNREREAYALTDIGVVYREHGDMASAEEYFQRSLSLTRAMKKRSLMKDNYRHLGLVHETLGDYSKALGYYKAYQGLQDSLFDERSQRLLADLEMQYEAEKRDKENVTLRAAQERHRLVIGLGSLLLAVVILSAAVLYTMYNQKREANRQLALSNRRIARQRDENKMLLHILSHDLANVLGNVRHCLGLVLEEPETLPEFAPMALQVTENGIEVITLVRQMHALEEGKLALETVNLREAVEAAELVVHDRVTAKKIAVVVEVDSATHVVVEHVSFINSVLTNVLTNAVKFSRRGQTVVVRAEELADGKQVYLTVRDEGVGMPADVQERLFDIERSTSRPGTEGERGVGFGMPLVKRFVELYGGAIDVCSREAPGDEGGTEVRIVLDRAEAPAPEPEGVVPQATPDAAGHAVADGAPWQAA